MFNRNYKGFEDCYRCTDRHEGCHSKCEKYLSAKQARAEQLEAEKLEEFVDSITSEERRARRGDNRRKHTFN